MTLFVNSQSGQPFIYEYDLNLQSPGTCGGACLFPAGYLSQPCPFSDFSAHGGARTIGTQGGVWLTVNSEGLWCIDNQGGSEFFSDPTGGQRAYYDASVYFMA